MDELELARLLNNLPMWRTLSALPAEVSRLKLHVATLEQALLAGAIDPLVCPDCGNRMTATKSGDEPIFGAADARLFAIACPVCGHQEEKVMK